MRKPRIAAFLFLATIVTVPSAAPASARASNPRTEMRGKVEAVVQAGAPGSVARLDVGFRHWTVAAGVRGPNHPVPISTQTRFRVGSITKTFVATVVL